MANKLLYIDKVKENQAEFEKKVRRISFELGINPDWLMFVMNNESGLNSKAVNPYTFKDGTHATGLIQFTGATAIQLGTTTKELYDMSNITQLDYVYKYLKTYKRLLNTYTDVYLAIFYPVALGKGEDYSFPQWVTAPNKIFDLNKDGIIKTSEITKHIESRVPAGYLPEFKKKACGQ